MQDNIRLDVLIKTVLDAMEQKKYSQRTVRNYRIRFNHLQRLAKVMGTDFPSEKLFSTFIDEALDPITGNPDVLKLRVRIRCINLLTSVLENGSLDCSRKKQKDISAFIKISAFLLLLDDFLNQLKLNGLNGSTICSYKRIVSYFFIFCQKRGYTALSDTKTNDITEFILYVYQNGYFKPTTITSALSGFRQFLASHDHTRPFLLELPSHLPSETKIIEVYKEQELSVINEFLDGDTLSKRDIAICRLLIETGLRGVDVCKLKLEDINWDKDIICITQAKTGKPLNIPLRSSYGNAIADYILSERPDCSSEYLFLRSLAPYKKLEGAGAVWCILKRMEERAGIQKEGRISGSRLTRHNAASAMLRAGVPMADISAALGHRDPNIVMAYLSTDYETLASCTLPMPSVTKGAV